MELKMRGNAPVPDFKLRTGAFALLLSYAKLTNNCSADVSGNLKKRLGGTGVQRSGLLSFGYERKIILDFLGGKVLHRKGGMTHLIL